MTTQNMLAEQYKHMKYLKQEYLELCELVKFIKNKIDTKDYSISHYGNREYIDFKFPFYHTAKIYKMEIINLPCENIFRYIGDIDIEFPNYNISYDVFKNSTIYLSPKK